LSYIAESLKCRAVDNADCGIIQPDGIPQWIAY
jgi:hypothetical protein